MADTATPNVIRRADYAPPAFLIDTVALEFDLVPDRTVVRNTMRVRRNPDASRTAGVRQCGDRRQAVSQCACARARPAARQRAG
jgi:aminopeptidase N